MELQKMAAALSGAKVLSLGGETGTEPPRLVALGEQFEGRPVVLTLVRRFG